MAEWASMFDDCWEVTGPLADEAFAKVPAKRGVLLLAAGGDEPILLITAGSLRGRLRTRLAEDDADAPSRRTDLRQITRAVLWKLTDSHFETDLVFLELARTIWPRRYRSMLAWKRPRFVAVDCDEPFPHFAPTQDALTAGGQCIGPFPTAKSAEQFIQNVQDAFDLCRDIKCLRTAPNGQPCSYAQMGRCGSPCDGTMSMDDYRQIVRKAADFAAGDRQTVAAELTEEMTAAAEKLAFEKASSIKTRLRRLEEFKRPAYDQAAPLGDFKFLFVQRGPNRQAAKTFFINGPIVAAGPVLTYPPDEKQLSAAIEQMAAVASAEAPADEAGRWRMGLVAQQVFTSGDRRGLVLRWRDGLTAAGLAEVIESSADVLKLRAPKRRKGRPKKEPQAESPK
ncbi:MAG: UvrB/UvrC motif-containing protein [Planctomycetota bacterium]|jgi:excinuclease UvrABC nuclease subunit